MRRRSRLFAGGALGVLALAGMPAAHAAETSPSSAVIVEARNTDAAAAAVHAVDGRVDMMLPLVNGVAAHVDASGITALEADTQVQVVPDAVMHPTSATFSASSVDTQVAALDPRDDLSPDAGRGVTVALIDTGVSDTPDLQGNRLVRGIDLSGDGDGIDHYGHGTFMAGLIAGDGSASANAPTQHLGVAPAARILSVKVAGADGSASVSRVIAAIGWVISHRDTYHVSVMNLSFGVDFPMPYFANPLDGAAEAAWASGITVIAAAGNEGADSVTSPGDDPYVITAGATNTAGTASTSDDSVTAWTGTEAFRGYAKPDVVAPGISVISLRDPGSTIDVQHPEGRVDDTYFRGSGTSMSTAIVSGAAAVLLSHHPGATPDDVKGALVDGAATTADGANAVDIAASDNATARPAWWQHYPLAFGGLGVGLHDGMPWTATRWTATRWTATRWTQEDWDATRWTATRWTATRWTDAEWAASRWTNTDWTASRWTATRWTATAWPSQTWG
jgi:serine protease AprX